jgi:hypothetical protein
LIAELDTLAELLIYYDRNHLRSLEPHLTEIHHLHFLPLPSTSTGYFRSIHSAMDMTLRPLLYVVPGQPSPVAPSLPLPCHHINAVRGDTDFSRAVSPTVSNFSGSHAYQNENVSVYGGDDSDSPAGSIFPGSSGVTSHLSHAFSGLYESVSLS